MAPDDTDFLSTPAEYATPQQLAAAREYAKYNLQEGGQQPVKHWTQGLSNMVSALVGGYGQYRAGQRELASRNLAASDETPKLPGVGAAPAAGTSPSALAPMSSDGSLPSSPGTVAAEGTKGNYGALGPIITDKNSSYNGDRAYGKYQVMGKNVPDWTAKHYGQRLTPDQYLNNPDAQEAVYKGQFGGYLKKYGNQADAASAWFTGQPLAQARARGAHDQNMGVDQYVKNHLGGLAKPPPPEALPGGAGGQAMPFSGQPASEGSPNADALMTFAQGKGGASPTTPPPPGVGPRPTAAPTGTPTGQIIDPATAPQRIQIPREQMMRVMASPWIPDDRKKEMLQQYYQQIQPLEAKTMGGSVVIGRDGQQRFVPDVHMGAMEAGGAKMPVAQTVGPEGIRTLPQVGGTVTPGAVGTPPPVAAPRPAGAPSGAQIPNIMKLQDEGDGLSEPVGAGGAGPGMMAPPPEATSAAPGTKTAQAIPQQMNDLVDWSNKKAGEKKQQEELGAKDAENYSTTSNNLMKFGQAAQEFLPQIELANKYVHDPNIIQGFLSGPRTKWAEAKAMLGGDPKAAAISEAFDKLTSGKVLGDMRETLQGLGQVRVSELDLLKQANASRGNTPLANQAILDIALKVNKQIQGLSSIASDYGKGIRWDANGDAYQSSEPPTNAGLREATKRYLDAHPLYTQKQIDEYKKRFYDDSQFEIAAPKGKAGALGTSPPAATPSSADIERQKMQEELRKRGIAH